MESVKSHHHEINQMTYRAILAAPISLFGGSLVLDLVARLTENGVWSEAAFWTMAVGLVLGFLIAPMQHRERGLMTWSTIPAPSQRREDLITAATLILFSLAWLLRRGMPSSPGALSLLFSFLGLLTAIGGEKRQPAENSRTATAMSRIPRQSTSSRLGIS